MTKNLGKLRLSFGLTTVYRIIHPWTVEESEPFAPSSEAGEKSAANLFCAPAK
jgi:hypothetical protein